MRNIDWQENCKDAMWSMFWMQQRHKLGAGADKEALKETLKSNVEKVFGYFQ